jgi:hypothetical protein
VWDGTFDGNHNSKITWDNLLDQSADWRNFIWTAWLGRQTTKEGGIDEWKTEN